MIPGGLARHDLRQEIILLKHGVPVLLFRSLQEQDKMGIRDGFREPDRSNAIL